MKRQALTVFYLVMLCSCEITPENCEPEPNIYAMLSADSLHALVMVGKTLGLNDAVKIDTVIIRVWDDSTNFHLDTSYRSMWNGVSGLDVCIKDAYHSFSCIEKSDQAGCYDVWTIYFSPGETWNLEVDYPGGNKITAKTTIPGNFQITSPLHDTLRFYDILRWEKPAGSKGYTFSVVYWSHFFGKDSVLQRMSLSWSFDNILLPADSCSIPVPVLWFYGDFLEVPDSLFIFVSALDTNAYDYYYYAKLQNYSGVDNVDAEKYMHIPEAWGVFGSRVVTSSRRYFLPSTPAAVRGSLR